jgi:predicted dehydrogenase
MNVGVIGAGFGRRVVAPVFAETAGCNVVDVVSARADAEIAALIARPDVDLVSVHSPPFLHAPHVRAALAGGKAVLCDKPFALDADEAAELEAEAAAAGVVALCNFEFRYAAARGMLRDLLADGTIGALEHIQWTHISSGTRVPLRPWGWLFDRALGGGWIGGWASHAVDSLRHTFATEIVDVSARLRIDVAERPDGDGVFHACTAEDGLTAALELENGATVAIDSGFAAVATVAPRLTVFGSNAIVDVVADERITIRHREAAAETIDVEPEARAADRHLAPMRRFAEVVRDAVETGEVPAHAPTFADGRACDAVLDELRAAPFARDRGRR